MTPPLGNASQDSNSTGAAADKPIALIRRSSVREAPMPKPEADRRSTSIRSEGVDKEIFDSSGTIFFLDSLFGYDN